MGIIGVTVQRAKFGVVTYLRDIYHWKLKPLFSNHWRLTQNSSDFSGSNHFLSEKNVKYSLSYISRPIQFKPLKSLVFLVGTLFVEHLPWRKASAKLWTSIGPSKSSGERYLGVPHCFNLFTSISCLLSPTPGAPSSVPFCWGLEEELVSAIAKPKSLIRAWSFDRSRTLEVLISRWAT